MQINSLGVPNLHAFMQNRSIRGEILHLDVPTPTVETAARAVNASVDQIIKSILFMVDEQPVLAIACGNAMIRQRAIASVYGVSKKKVRLASPIEVLIISGYEVGAMPPFGHRQPLVTLLDKRVLDIPLAYAGGGAENALLRVNPQEILKVSGARVLDLLG